MASVIVTDARIHIVTDALTGFARILVAVILFIPMIIGIPFTRVSVTMIATITLPTAIAVAISIPVAGLAITGAVANDKDNTTASAVVVKRRVDMIAAFSGRTHLNYRLAR